MNTWIIVFRSITRRRRMGAAAVLLLGGGIAAVTATFTVGNVLVVGKLPWRNADKVVIVSEKRVRAASSLSGIAPANFIDLERDAHSSFDLWSAWVGVPRTLRGGAFPEALQGVACSPGLFSLLGIPTEAGRIFGSKETDVVLISDALWRRQFHGQRSVLGRSVELDGKPYQVLGVIPSHLAYPPNADFWLPLNSIAPLLHMRQAPIFSAVARLRHADGTVTAQRELDVIGARLREQYPIADRNLFLNLQPFRRAVLGDTRPLLALLSTASIVLLLIACGNVIAMLLAAALDRRQEIAIQIALGADKWRLRNQFFLEGLSLSALAGACGLMLTPLLLRSLEGMVPEQVLASGHLSVDWTALLFTCCVCTFCALTFAAVPAVVYSRADQVGPMLQTGARHHTADKRSHMAWSILVASEVALTVSLCVSAGILTRTFLELTRANLGYDPMNVITARVSLSGPEYDDDAKKIAAAKSLLETLAKVPGVNSAGLATFVPLGGASNRYGFALPSSANSRLSQPEQVPVEVVDGNYFQTLHIELRRGRLFSPSDNSLAVSPGVCLINQAFSDLYFGQSNPIDETITLGQQHEPYRIVGVVGNTRQEVQRAPDPSIFLLYTEAPWAQFDLVLRSTISPTGLLKNVRSAIRQADPNLPIIRVTTLEALLRGSLADRRLRMAFASLYSGACLILVVTGLYAIVDYSTRKRKREIAVRMAFGATPRAIFGWVLHAAATPVVAGLAAGLLLSLPVCNAISAFLYGVRPADPATLAFVSILAMSVCLIAICIPARQACNVDPVASLRDQ